MPVRLLSELASWIALSIKGGGAGARCGCDSTHSRGLTSGGMDPRRRLTACPVGKTFRQLLLGFSCIGADVCKKFCVLALPSNFTIGSRAGRSHRCYFSGTKPIFGSRNSVHAFSSVAVDACAVPASSRTTGPVLSAVGAGGQAWSEEQGSVPEYAYSTGRGSPFSLSNWEGSDFWERNQQIDVTVGQ